MGAPRRDNATRGSGGVETANRNRPTNLTKFQPKTQANRRELLDLLASGCPVTVGVRNNEARVLCGETDYPLDQRWVIAIAADLEGIGNFAPIQLDLLREMLEFCAVDRVLP